jgi:hypothetical protein
MTGTVVALGAAYELIPEGPSGIRTVRQSDRPHER